MRVTINRREWLKWSGTAMALSTLPTWAQSTWPSKAIVVVVPFPAGGGTDAFARPLSAGWTAQLGKQIIIDNRGGAGGTLGASVAAKAVGDGYTLFMGGSHHSIAPAMYLKLDYNLQTDFIPLALVARVPQVLVVNQKNVPTDFNALLEAFRQKPGKYNYGSAGSGTSHHLAGELFKIQTQTDLTHVPYRGTGPALQGLLAGDVDVMFDGLGSSAKYISSGRLKALMVSGSARNAAFPDIPCAAELGLPDYTVTTWYGLWAPKGTPADIQAKIIADVQKLPDTEVVKNAWALNGAEFPSLTGAEFGKFVDSEIKRWAEVVKISGTKLD